MQRPRTAADRGDDRAAGRDGAADRRDEVADARDEHALHRDDMADDRDGASRDHTDDMVARICAVRGRLADHLERLEQFETDPRRRDLIARDRATFSALLTEILAAFARIRDQRRASKQDRSFAADDREASAYDRASAARDRFDSAADREQSAIEREQTDYVDGNDLRTDHD
jgi:hypothetical protein